MSDNQKYKQFYSDEAQVYESTRYESGYGSLFRELHYKVVSDICKRIPSDAQVLEVACGTGHTTRLLNSLGISTIACDLTPEMMMQAKNTIDAAKADTEFVQTSAFSLPFAEDSIDFLVSTRFLHLFGTDDQYKLMQEFCRVLKPEGTLLVDLDNLVARWLYAIPHFFYNIIRYRRFAPDSHYSSPRQALRLLTDNGFQSPTLYGVGGWHLYLVKIFSANLAYRIGLWHRFSPFRVIAEQFVVVGKSNPAVVA